MKNKGGFFGEAYRPRAKNILSERFVVPPFSVLNARDGDWQRRKRQWISLGIKSELGRGDAVTFQSGGPGDLQKGLVRALNAGKDVYLYPTNSAGEALVVEGAHGGTSIFDPVLCEVAYRWFCPPGGKVLDPFAGGSVRGVVASVLGLNYQGIDLSLRQCRANREQAIDLDLEKPPVWVAGDSAKILAQQGTTGLERRYDFIFTCPPYGDLEVYSDDPADLSNMPTDDFDDAMALIIERATLWLKPDSFACFVVGDYRDKKTGMYRNFPSKIIAMFAAAGMELYNQIILQTAVGSLPLRVTGQFEAGRKVGQTHQQVLVFTNGNPNKFTRTWGKYENS